MVPFRCTVKHHWSILPFTGEHPVDKEGFQALLPDHATCAIIPRSRLEGHPAPGQAMTSGLANKEPCQDGYAFTNEVDAICWVLSTRGQPLCRRNRLKCARKESLYGLVAVS
jgi:hypothetical protein